MSTLQLHIDGPGGEIAFESYVRLLDRSLQILRATDSAVTGATKGVLDWVVVSLASTEGLDATIRSKPRKRARVDERTDQRVAASYVEALTIAEGGEALPPHLSDSALEHLVRLASGLNRNGAEALRTTFVEERQAATVSPTTAENIKRLRVTKSKAIGSIIGRLETVSVHHANRYSVYDDVTKRPVRCEFKDAELREVTAVLGRRVKVAGVIHRNAKGQPLRVDQPRMTVMPSREELPTTDEFVGVARDFTGDLSTEEHLRRLRDA